VLHADTYKGGDEKMKYRVDVSLEGYIEVEADSQAEAREHAEDGFSISDFNCEDTEVGEISLIREA